MIPKKIYYCWFGDAEMSKLDKICMKSWKYYCPDYEIIRISEDNYDYKQNPYALQGYEAGDWSAVSNAARLDFLLNDGGGFYLDTDVVLFKSLDELRPYDGGFITEFESGQPDSGVLGCGANGCGYYEEVFSRLLPNTILHREFISVMYRDYDIHGEGITTYDDGFTVIGEEYFPSVRTSLRTPNTIGIHYFENTWANIKRKTVYTDKAFPTVRVYKDGNIIHQDKKPIVKMVLKNTRKDWWYPDMWGKICYFFNPKVVKLSNRDFDCERIGYDKNKEYDTTFTPSGLLVWHEKSEG